MNHTETESPRPPNSLENILSNPLVWIREIGHHFTTLKEHLRSAFLRSDEIWSSLPYFEHALTAENIAEASQSFYFNFESFIDEYLFFLKKVMYPFSAYGMTTAEGETQNTLKISDINRNFRNLLKERGMSTDRAKLEVLVAERLEAFIADTSIPAGSIFVHISRRGGIDEGYPGEKLSNYLFLNFYQKTNKNHQRDTAPTTLHQYRSYDLPTTAAQLPKRLLRAANSGYYYRPADISTPPSFTSTSRDAHHTIEETLILSPDTTFRQLENEIYRYENSDEYGWEITTADLPDIPEPVLEDARSTIMNEMHSRFKVLASRVRNPEDALDRETAARQLDRWVDNLRQYILNVWIKSAARNYRQQLQEEGLFIDKLALDLTAIDDYESQKAAHGDIASASLTVLNSLGGSAQCYTLAPFSMAAGGISGGLPISQLTSPEFLLQKTTFSKQEQRQYLDILNQMVALEVENHLTGGTETYYLYFQDQSLIEDYRGTLYIDATDGRVYSTLCGVALDEDELVWHLSVNEYTQLRASLTEHAITQRLTTSLDGETRTNALAMKQQLFGKIFPTSTLSSVIAGVQYLNAEHLIEFSSWLLEQLHKTSTPLQFMEYILSRIEAENFDAVWRQLTQLDENDIRRNHAETV